MVLAGVSPTGVGGIAGRSIIRQDRRPRPTQRTRPVPSRARRPHRRRRRTDQPLRNGRITPSADVIIRLAETFDVSCDYLLLDDAPRRPLQGPDHALGDHLNTLTELSPDDLTLVTSFIDALVTKTRLKVLAGGT